MDIRYPIGNFEHEGEVSPETRTKWINELEKAPKKIREAVSGLTEEQIDTPYREGGWTPRQIIHHIADSNLNMYIRYKLALTENNPEMKTYNETLWSQLTDAKKAPVDSSLLLLEGLHIRWVSLLCSLSDKDFSQTFIHPESGKIRLDKGVGIYSWHTNHHTAPDNPSP